MVVKGCQGKEYKAGDVAEESTSAGNVEVVEAGGEVVVEEGGGRVRRQWEGVGVVHGREEREEGQVGLVVRSRIVEMRDVSAHACTLLM